MLQEIFDNIAETLKYAAPSYLGRKNLPRTHSLPRFVWLLDGDDFAQPSNTNLNPEPNYDATYKIAVHVWGESVGQVEHLRAGLASALRQQLQGANYRFLRATWIEPEDGTRGVVSIVSLTIGPIPLVEQVLPEAYALPGQGNGPEKNLVDPADKALPLGTPTEFDFVAVDPADPSKLRAGETE
jgi:hypothetical protein